MLTLQSRPIAEALHRFALSKNFTYQHLLDEVTIDELLLFIPVYEAYMPTTRAKIEKRLGDSSTPESIENALLAVILPLLVDIFKEANKNGLS